MPFFLGEADVLAKEVCRSSITGKAATLARLPDLIIYQEATHYLEIHTHFFTI